MKTLMKFLNKINKKTYFYDNPLHNIFAKNDELMVFDNTTYLFIKKPDELKNNVVYSDALLPNQKMQEFPQIPRISKLKYEGLFATDKKFISDLDFIKNVVYKGNLHILNNICLHDGKMIASNGHQLHIADQPALKPLEEKISIESIVFDLLKDLIKEYKTKSITFKIDSGIIEFLADNGQFRLITKYSKEYVNYERMTNIIKTDDYNIYLQLPTKKELKTVLKDVKNKLTEQFEEQTRLTIMSNTEKKFKKQLIKQPSVELKVDGFYMLDLCGNEMKVYNYDFSVLNNLNARVGFNLKYLTEYSGCELALKKQKEKTEEYLDVASIKYDNRFILLMPVKLS